VMLALKPVGDLIDEGLGRFRDDLHYSMNPERAFIQGQNPATHVQHITLLYGLLPGVTQQHVIDVMQGWQPPADLMHDWVERFPSPYGADDPDADYECLVARFDGQGSDNVSALADAHARLSLLPHIDTFPEFKPHATLAYVKSGAAQNWEETLNMETFTFTVDTSEDPRGLKGKLVDILTGAAS